MKKSIQKVSEQTLKIENLLSNAAPGEVFTYKQIQQLTGVVMNNKGKAYLRTALKRLKLPYENLWDEGIRTVSAQNALRIITHKVISIDNSVKRAEKTTQNVKAKVYESLSDNEKNTTNHLLALFGTIRAYASAGKKMFFSEQKIKVDKTINQ